MQTSERHDIILQKLSSQEMVTIQELADMFDISIRTVRRDLDYLEKERLIKKVYGGAILFNRPTNGTRSFDVRTKEHLSEKAAIGQKCAELINDGDSLYLGPGTTVRQVAVHLREHKNLTVLTDSLYVANELLDTDTEIYFMGGCIYNRGAHLSSIIPPDAWDFFHPNKAIIGVSGINANYGVTDFHPRESAMLRSIIDRAVNVLVVADNSKFGLIGPCATCSLSRINRIITGIHGREDILKDFEPYRHKFLFADNYIPDNSELVGNFEAFAEE
ncbi:MAG: DeoR/GlpR transcriptional regulator [Oscillospiraceae bacterium]|nr:DeoR/GlpR transcriptional regulator [Oscillospiraceae bacterium]